MRKIAILQSNYIPWRGYFDIISKVDIFVIYDEVQFTKNDWRNRNKIKTPNGLIWLTIPVKQNFLHQKINETEVANQFWRKQHLNSLKLNYSKAPFFDKFFPEIEKIYLGNEINLSEINIKFISRICELLEIKTKIVDSKDLTLVGDKNERLVDACEKLNANVYLSGPAAKNYLDESLFNRKNINVEWMDYSNYKEYTQLYPPFNQGVSVLDILFNVGKIDII